MAKARTVRSKMVGKKSLRIVEKGGRFYGLVDGRNIVEADTADAAWQRLNEDMGKHDPGYFGFEGARARFRHFFPNGFQSKGFEQQERDYKVAAKAKLDAGAPLDLALDGAFEAEAALAAIRATNVIYPVDKAKLSDLLRGADAVPFIQASARFAVEPTAANLTAIARILKPHRAASWSCATYLPFLWRPETHMFLKPQVTQDFATRVGHLYAEDYRSALDVSVYQSLLDLVEKTERELADMRPRDRIDVQSFIWVVGDYKEGREGVYP